MFCSTDFCCITYFHFRRPTVFPHFGHSSHILIHPGHPRQEVALGRAFGLQWRGSRCLWWHPGATVADVAQWELLLIHSNPIPWYPLILIVQSGDPELRMWYSWDWFQIVETCWNIVSGTLRDDASSKDQLIIPFESMWCCLLRKNHKQGSILSVSRPAKKQ